MRTHQKRCVRISLLPCCRGLALYGLLLLLPRRKLPLALLALEICLYLREQAPGQGLQLVVGYPALVRSHTSPHSSLYDFLFQRCAHAWALYKYRGLHFNFYVSSSLFLSCASSFFLRCGLWAVIPRWLILACPFYSSVKYVKASSNVRIVLICTYSLL